ncbi:CGNR zinc finger domain-containing protein [Actinomadura macrotermitis]|uniref:Zinc finger CGNR domain-containing protein n=1 Tax=Actinomadura macrotermitis TaxID=2585200 RepID=A0A7K0BW77_9ACTN|nr:ABATE domain-containing protein [Actinomadura macrotermitis]MQY05430.1 hypothetical protein [Actinomadura macrotermitis]
MAKLDWFLDGHPAIDLVNTVRRRKIEPVDLIATPGELAGWLAAAGLCARPAEVTQAHLRKIARLREAVHALVSPDGHPEITEADIAVINRCARQYTEPVLALAADRVTVTVPTTDTATQAIATIARLAIALVAGRARGHVKICGATDCGIRFLDTSPKRNRQWCSMAVCGNRAKAQRHYSRNR